MKLYSKPRAVIDCLFLFFLLADAVLLNCYYYLKDSKTYGFIDHLPDIGKTQKFLDKQRLCYSNLWQGMYCKQKNLLLQGPMCILISIGDISMSLAIILWKAHFAIKPSLVNIRFSLEREWVRNCTMRIQLGIIIIIYLRALMCYIQADSNVSLRFLLRSSISFSSLGMAA